MPAVGGCGQLTGNCSIDSSHSLMVPVYANDSCSPWAERGFPCTLGAYVHYAVNVSSLEHVVTTLDFVRGNNIRLVIRNTGHEYAITAQNLHHAIC